jgi:hypothetical protein
MGLEDALVVEGKILDIHLDGAEIVLILDVSTAWRTRPPEPVPSWRKVLLRPGESWPRFRGSPSLVNRSLGLGQQVVVLARPRDEGWELAEIAPERGEEPRARSRWIPVAAERVGRATSVG